MLIFYVSENQSYFKTRKKDLNQVQGIFIVSSKDIYIVNLRILKQDKILSEVIPFCLFKESVWNVGIVLSFLHDQA